MDDDDQFLNQVLSGISEAEIITIFFPLLGRSLVVDTRHSDDAGQMVKVMSQVGSMDERITSIQQIRPQFGKIRSILGVPWVKSINSLEEQGVAEQLAKRLVESGMPRHDAEVTIRNAAHELSRIERRSYIAMIRGEGYRTIWSAQQ